MLSLPQAQPVSFPSGDKWDATNGTSVPCQVGRMNRRLVLINSANTEGA